MRPRYQNVWRKRSEIDLAKLTEIYAVLRWRWQRMPPTPYRINARLDQLEKEARADPEHWFGTGGLDVRCHGAEILVAFDKRLEKLYAMP